MLGAERLARIVRTVRDRGGATVPELAEALGISASTVRRDLAALDKEGRVAKVHGGAMSLERAHVTRDLTIGERGGLHTGEKERICSRAASLVGEAGLVYIDSGSTTLHLVDMLPPLRGVVCVTDSVGHARRLVARGLRTIVLGGSIKPETEAVVGPDAIATLGRYNFAIGFWGANGIDERAGLTTPDPEEAEVKRASMARSARRVVIADASKLGMVAPVTFAPLDGVEVLTAGEVPGPYRTRENVTVL